MTKHFTLAAIAVATLCLSTAADAHRAWIKPDATVLSKPDAWVTFDAGISNEIFARDYVAFRLDNVTAFAPDGSELALANPFTGKTRSVFDLQLTQSGTYKIVSAQANLQARWVDEQGERQFWPGRGVVPKAGDFEAQVPKQAQDLTITDYSRRVETFVTNGAPTEQVLQPQNQGIELLPITHPNDLYAGETAEFKLLIDGQPASGAEVVVIPEGMRYRDQQNAQQLTTDEQGLFQVTWPTAGQYFMEIDYQDSHGKAPATQRRGSYSAVFEVL